MTEIPEHLRQRAAQARKAEDPGTETSLWTPYRALLAEGARIGLMSCKVCGVTVTIDPGDSIDYAALHERTHETPPEPTEPTEPDLGTLFTAVMAAKASIREADDYLDDVFEHPVGSDPHRYRIHKATEAARQARTHLEGLG